MQLDRLFAFAKTFGIPGDHKAAAGFYVGLAKLPPDLLVKAFDAAVSSRKDTYRLPTPAEIEAAVLEDWGVRRRVLARLEMMDRAPVDDGPQRKRSGAAFEEFQAQWAKTKMELAAKSQAIKG